MRRLRELELGDRPDAARRGKPAERRSEEELGEESGEEDRRRVDDDPEQPPADVDWRIAPAPGGDADRNPDRERNRERGDRELEGGRPVLDNDVADRAVVGEGRAEVARDGALQVVAVLLEDRSVVSGAVASDRDLLL